MFFGSIRSFPNLWNMSLFFISLWLTLKETRVIWQDAVRLTLSIQYNYKTIETIRQAMNSLCPFQTNLFAWVICHPNTNYSLKRPENVGIFSANYYCCRFFGTLLLSDFLNSFFLLIFCKNCGYLIYVALNKAVFNYWPQIVISKTKTICIC